MRHYYRVQNDGIKFFQLFSAKDLCGYRICIGHSLRKAISRMSKDQLSDIISVYEKKNYMIIPNFRNKTLYVALGTNESSEDVIAAYFHAVILGVALCRYNNEPMVKITNAINGINRY